MISLHVYLTPKPGMEDALDAAVCEDWLPALMEQPGAISAASVKPFSDGDLEALGALKPDAAVEAVCFWESEQARLDWVALPLHDEVFAKVVEAADSVSYTLQDVDKSWNV